MARGRKLAGVLVTLLLAGCGTSAPVSLASQGIGLGTSASPGVLEGSGLRIQLLVPGGGPNGTTLVRDFGQQAPAGSWYLVSAVVPAGTSGGHLEAYMATGRDGTQEVRAQLTSGGDVPPDHLATARVAGLQPGTCRLMDDATDALVRTFQVMPAGVAAL